MAVNYSQLQNAKLSDFQSNADLQKVFGTAYFGAGNESQISGLMSQWGSGARNFDSDKSYVLGQLGNLGGSDLRSSLDRYGNWNGSTNPADQANALTERNKGLASLKSLEDTWGGYGLDVKSLPNLQNYYTGFGATPGSGLNTKQTAVANAAGMGSADNVGNVPNILAGKITPQPGTPGYVDTSQPSPSTVNATPYTGAAQTANAGVQQGLVAAQASGPAPQDSGAGRAAVQSFMPGLQAPTFYKPDPNSQQVYDSTGKALDYNAYLAAGGKADFSNVKPGLPDTTAIEQQLAQDPGYQQLLKDQAEYNAVANQTKSLTDTYTQLSKDLGIPALNTELMNMKNIIDGSEDDIRQEIQKSGGFGTESQVLALTGARNKQLIKNYNNLLQVKTSAQDTLNTMIGLATQDRQFALSAITQKMQIDQQLIEYQDKMKTNAREALQKVIDSMGYKAVMTGDPWQDALTEKTLGLHPGGLAQLASIANKTNLKDYPVSYQEFLLAQQGGYKGNYNDYQNMDANRKASRSTTTNVTYNQAQDQTFQADVSQTTKNIASKVGGDGFISPSDWKRAYGDWTSAGHKGSDFVDSFRGYVNQNDPNYKQNYGVSF